jgi:ATP-dependent 26S proteasome regulatory subunit
MAINRPDALDPALVCPVRLDRKIGFSLLDQEGAPSFPKFMPI